MGLLVVSSWNQGCCWNAALVNPCSRTVVPGMGSQPPFEAVIDTPSGSYCTFSGNSFRKSWCSKTLKCTLHIHPLRFSVKQLWCLQIRMRKLKPGAGLFLYWCACGAKIMMIQTLCLCPGLKCAMCICVQAFHSKAQMSSIQSTSKKVNSFCVFGWIRST